MAPYSPVQRQRRTFLYLTLAISCILILFIVGTIAFFKFSPQPKSPVAAATAKATPMGVGVIQEPGNEYIGISDGQYAFDTSRTNGDLKRQGSEKFKNNDKLGAESLWLQASAKDTSDAEVLIYLEDLQVAKTGNYITLVIGTMLTGNDNLVGTGRDALQGAYVAQKEYNDGHKLSEGKLIYLLIANSGSNADYATIVAGQIVQAAKQDKTIVGVMGWSDSKQTVNANTVLSNAHIPMVSSTASADTLTHVSPYFFRVAPSNKYQAIEGAKYAEQQLGAQRVALFLDPNDPYSSSLGYDFQQQFTADGYNIVDIEKYTVGQKQDLAEKLNNALHNNPNLIYFAGYSDDASVLLINLPGSLPNLQVMGGDALYDLNGYPSSARAGFSRLRFTAFFYPDEWGILGISDPQPPFFQEYISIYNPTGQQPSGIYGITRADNDVALAYDTLTALLTGSQNVLASGKTTITPEELRDGLAQITGGQAIQGVSGKISFGPDGDPVNKAIVILYVDPVGHIKMVERNGIQGCFQLTANC